MALGGSGIACAQPGAVPEAAAPAMPETFVFGFGEYTLQRAAGSVTLTHRPAWSDAQRLPDATFADDQAPAVQLLPAEAQALWARIAALDPAGYRHPTGADFEPTPPDLRHTETLTWVVNGQTVAAWSHGYKFLRPELRRPLALIADALRTAYEEAASR